MNSFAITRVIGREIIDSRGNPTVEAEVTLSSGIIGRGAAVANAPIDKAVRFDYDKYSPIRTK